MSKDSIEGPSTALHSSPSRHRLTESGVGYHILVGLLFFLFIVQPWSESERSILFLYVVTFSIALAAVAPSKRTVAAGLSMLIPAVGFSLILTTPPVSFQVTGNLFFLGFIVLLITVFLTRIFHHTEVSATTISGSICVFLFLAMAWGIAYTVTDLLDPGAFSGLLSSSPRDRSSELFYFSFVTLTTLGYGDIAPVAQSARSLAMVEAIVGQLYLVVLVARFVGLHTRTGGAAAAASNKERRQ